MGLSIWNYIGGAVVFLLILALMGFGIWFFCLRKRKNKDRIQDGFMEEKAFLNAGAKNPGWKRY